MLIKGFQTHLGSSGQKIFFLFMQQQANIFTHRCNGTLWPRVVHKKVTSTGNKYYRFGQIFK